MDGVKEEVIDIKEQVKQMIISNDKAMKIMQEQIHEDNRKVMEELTKIAMATNPAGKSFAKRGSTLKKDESMFEMESIKSDK